MSRLLNTIRVLNRPGTVHLGIMVAGFSNVPCALGRTGTTRRKREGDGATPIGEFALRKVYYRPDRVSRPVSELPVQPIEPDLGWSDEPADPLYNRPVRLPQPGSHERMWRDDHLYDYVIVLGYNDAPPLRPWGSAVFLHLAGQCYPPTAGCVAISRRDMRRLLPRLGPCTTLVVAA